jgi:hypothetical protein
MDSISAPSIVSLFETTKEERKSFVQQVVSNAVDGNANMLQLHKQVKAMEDIVKSILASPEYKNELLAEAQKHGKSFKYLNDDWSIKESPAQYDFDACNDPIYTELNNELTKLEERISTRKEFLKAIPIEGVTMVVEDTGEVLKIYPPIKKSTTIVTIKMS